ncbi:MAG TPA: metal ABC transporter permease [Acidimicrobiales bacterium]|nr:metal ABC transporter permease [Acidimicrobiales bacterium]
MSAWIAQTFGSVEALAQVTLAALVGGVVGVHVVLRRLPFLVMGLTHATFPGLVIAGLLGVNLLAGTLAFGVFPGLVTHFGDVANLAATSIP